MQDRAAGRATQRRQVGTGREAPHESSAGVETDQTDYLLTTLPSSTSPTLFAPTMWSTRSTDGCTMLAASVKRSAHLGAMTGQGMPTATQQRAGDSPTTSGSLASTTAPTKELCRGRRHSSARANGKSSFNASCRPWRSFTSIVENLHSSAPRLGPCDHDSRPNRKHRTRRTLRFRRSGAVPGESAELCPSSAIKSQVAARRGSRNSNCAFRTSGTEVSTAARGTSGRPQVHDGRARCASLLRRKLVVSAWAMV